MPALPSSPSGRSPGLLRDVPVSLPPIPWPRLTPYHVSRQARAVDLLSAGSRGPAVRSTDNAGMDRGAKHRLRGGAQDELPCSRSARCRGTALTWLSSARPGLAPALPVPRTSPSQAAAQRRGGCPAPGLRAGQTCGRRLAPIPLPAPVPLQKGTAGKDCRGSCLRCCIHPFPPSWGSLLPVPLVGCPHHFGPFYRSPSCGSGCHHRHAFMRVGLCKACIKCSQKYEVLSFVKLIKMSNNFYKGKMSHWMAHFSLLAFYN